MTRTVWFFALMCCLVVLGPGCGGTSDRGESIPASADVARSVPGVSITSVPPEVGELRIVDGCAEVHLTSGDAWATSCLQPSPRVRAVVSETVDGFELALLRFPSDAEIVGTDPIDIAVDQMDGWAFVVSGTSDYTLTLRAGSQSAVCAYDPVFIDCEVVPGE